MRGLTRLLTKVCYWDEDKNIVYDKAKFKIFADFLSFGANIDFDTDEFGRYDKIYYGNHIPNGYLVRKSIFDKIGKFTREAPLEDWWPMLQIAKYAKMKFLDEILYSYRWYISSIIKNGEKIAGFVRKLMEYENQLLVNVGDSGVLLCVLK